MSRRIEVVVNDYPDATHGGLTVRVILWHNRNQSSAMTLTPDEAEALLKALSDHLTIATRGLRDKALDAVMELRKQAAGVTGGGANQWKALGYNEALDEVRRALTTALTQDDTTQEGSGGE